MNVEKFLAAKSKEIDNYRKVKVTDHETSKYVSMIMDSRLWMMNELSLELEKYDKGKAMEIATKWRRACDKLEDMMVFGDPA
jgi:hypothetical protein